MNFSSFVGKFKENNAEMRITISNVGDIFHCFFYNGDKASGQIDLHLSEMPDTFQAMYTKCKLLEE